MFQVRQFSDAPVARESLGHKRAVIHRLYQQDLEARSEQGRLFVANANAGRTAAAGTRDLSVLAEQAVERIVVDELNLSAFRLHNDAALAVAAEPGIKPIDVPLLVVPSKPTTPTRRVEITPRPYSAGDSLGRDIDSSKTAPLIHPLHKHQAHQVTMPAGHSDAIA